jgi:hypothetical protein
MPSTFIALAQTTKPAAALALPGSLVTRPFGTSMPGKTNVLIGCIGPFKTRPTAARAMEEGIKLAIADAAKTLGPNVNLLLECVDTAGDKDLAAAAMKYLVGKKAGGSTQSDWCCCRTLNAWCNSCGCWPTWLHCQVQCQHCMPCL